MRSLGRRSKPTHGSGSRGCGRRSIAAGSPRWNRGSPRPTASGGAPLRLAPLQERRAAESEEGLRWAREARRRRICRRSGGPWLRVLRGSHSSGAGGALDEAPAVVETWSRPARGDENLVATELPLGYQALLKLEFGARRSGGCAHSRRGASRRAAGARGALHRLRSTPRARQAARL